MEDVTIKDFITSVSSRTATPGAGATAAVTASMAVATILMAVRFSDVATLTAKNKETIRLTIEELEDMREEFRQLVRKDEEGFIDLSNAFKMPAETMAEKKAKEKSVQEGLIIASEVPIKLIHEVRRAQLIVEKIYPLIKQNIVADIGVGLELLQAVAHSSAYNVYSNVRFLKNKPRKIKITTSVEKKIASIDKLNRLMLKSVKSIIKH